MRCSAMRVIPVGPRRRARVPAPTRAALVLAVLFPLAASTARAEFGASLQTVARAYDSLETIDDIERVRSWRSLDQYARLTWDDLGRRKAWTIDTSLRYRLDWGTGKASYEHVDEEAGPGTRYDDDVDVMIARASWRSERGLVGVQLGRIQSVTGMGWKAFDGARLDFARLRNLRVFTFAGAPVDLAVNGAPDLGGFTCGAGVTGIVPRHGTFGVDYEIRKIDSDATALTSGFPRTTTEETAGFDMDLRFKDTEIAGNADYSLVYDSFGETAILLRQGIARRHHATLGLTRVRPIFPTDSIYAVFESNPYDEVRASYEFSTDSGRLAVGGYASRESYEDTALPGGDDIQRVAATVRWQDRSHGSHRSEGGWLDGWSGSRLTVRHDSDFDVTPRLRVGGGASFQDFENFAHLTDRDQIWALRARVGHDHFGKWDLALEVEQYFGRDRNATRGVLTFGTRFGSARHERPWWGGRIQHAWRPPVASSRDSQAEETEQ